MRRHMLLLLTGAALTGGVAYTGPAPSQPDEAAAPIARDQLPPGYRDWRLISVAHFDDGRPIDKERLHSCFECHQSIEGRDLVFTRYSP